MGGNVIKSSVRLIKHSYQKVWEQLSKILNSKNLEHKIIKAYEDKEDFGDIDMLVNYESGNLSKLAVSQ